MRTSSLHGWRNTLFGKSGLLLMWPPDQSFVTAYAKIRPVWLNDVVAIGPPLFSKAVGRGRPDCQHQADKSREGRVRPTLESRLALLVPEIDGPVRTGSRKRAVRVELDVVDGVHGRRFRRRRLVFSVALHAIRSKGQWRSGAAREPGKRTLNVKLLADALSSTCLSRQARRISARTRSA